MKIKLLFPILLLGLLSLFCKRDKDDRFKYYKPIGKTEEMEVIYLTWPDTNLPNFVKYNDYKKFKDRHELIDYCFYLDSKDPEKRKFKDPNTTNKLINKEPVKIKGKFYKTKQFDETFPTPLFEDLRMTMDLKFKPKNNEFLVFVLD